MNFCSISHWRHGSTARPRELTPDEKRERYVELKASHKWVVLSRALNPLRDASDAFYQGLFGEASDQSVPQGRMQNHQLRHHGPAGARLLPSVAHRRPAPS